MAKKELVEVHTGEIVHIQESKPIAITEMVNSIKYIEDFVKEILVQDVDYGIIEGTKKPTIYKAGAEKLAYAFNLSAEYSKIGRASCRERV